MYDVLIIGGGVTGSAIARELSRYDLKTALFEKGEDVCSGTSKANSGIAHAGFDAAPGSWKAKMNIRGSRMLEELSRKLDFPCADRRHRLPLQAEHRPGGECGCERGGVPSEGRSSDSRKGRLSGTCGRLSCGDGERKL